MFQNSFEYDPITKEFVNTIETEMVGLHVISIENIYLPVKTYSIEFEVSEGRPFNVVEEFILKIATNKTLKNSLSISLLSEMMKLDDIFINNTLVELQSLRVFEKDESDNYKLTDSGFKYFQEGSVPTPPKVHKLEVLYDTSFGTFIESSALTDPPPAEYDHPTHLRNLDQPINGKVTNKLIADIGKLRGKLYENSATGSRITHIAPPQLAGEGFIQLTQCWIQDIVEDKLFTRVIERGTGRYRQDIEKLLGDHGSIPTPRTSSDNIAQESPKHDQVYQSYNSKAKQYLKQQRDGESDKVVTPIKLLRGGHIRAEFLNAIKSTKKRLLIVSPWMTEKAIDSKLISMFRDIVRNGGSVFLGWGISKRQNQEENPPTQILLEKLEKIKNSAGVPGVHVVWLGNTHSKEVVVDDKIHLAGSHNWMSYRGDYLPRGEQVYLVCEPDIVAAASRDLENMFGKKIKGVISKNEKSIIRQADLLFALSRLLSEKHFEEYVQKLDWSDELIAIICKIYLVNNPQGENFKIFFDLLLDSSDALVQAVCILSYISASHKNLYTSLIKSEKYQSRIIELGALNDRGKLNLVVIQGKKLW